MTHRPSRRAINAFLASAVLWPRGSLASIRNSPSNLLHAAFDDPAKARVVGAACLSALPEQTAPQLVGAIVANLDNEALGSRQAFKRQLTDRVRDDFARGMMVSANGWLLSLTEARLYALAALYYCAA